MATPHDLLHDVARKHGFTTAAAEEALTALRRTGGFQAQFRHPELGGYGQWMSGGMLMIGDMFNHHLKGRVDGLFNELSRRLNEFAAPPSGGGGGSSGFAGGGGGSDASGGSYSYAYGSSNQYANWYPSELGIPSSSGAQNDFRWAFFPGTRRLAIQLGQDLAVYDTEDHAIHSASQQQDGRGGHIVLTSQRGHVDVGQLRKVR